MYSLEGLLETLTCHTTPKYFIPGPTRALIHRLSEVGYLYTRVESFVREREAATGVGMIEQSLCHHLQTQLTEYYRLIAVLESQMAPQDTQGDPVPRSGSDAVQRSTGGETGLTLRRLDVWINEWRLRMRMMSVCVEGARGMSALDRTYDYLDPLPSRCPWRCSRKFDTWVHGKR
jgi:gamma-tubulin complex component 3